jgi:hypothetical protein
MSKTKEFLEIVSELYTGLEEHGLEVPPEISGPWASTIFINQYGEKKSGSAGSKPASGSSEVLEVSGALEVKMPPKTMDNGKTQYGIKVAGEWFNTLSLEAFKNRKFNVGDHVIVKYRVNGKYKNLVEVMPDGNAPEDADIPF